MDEDTLNKLKQYLASKKQTNALRLFGMPAGDAVNTSTPEELEKMPSDVRNLVVKSELEHAGNYIPNTAGYVGYDKYDKQRADENNMAKELGAALPELNADTSTLTENLLGRTPSGPSPQMVELQKQILRKRAGY